MTTPATDTYCADWDRAEAGAGLRAARDLMLQVERLGGLPEDVAGDLAANIQEHIGAPEQCGYRESEIRVGEGRVMVDTARRLANDVGDRYGRYSSEQLLVDDAIYELREHLARLERADLELRTGAAAAA